MPVELDHPPHDVNERQVAVSAASGHQELTHWAHCATMILGGWLISSPPTLGYQSPLAIWSDVISGALLLVFGGFALSPRHCWAPWAACLVGLWLHVAPLVFWAPDAAAYANNTLVGVLAIAFALLIPGVPGARSSRGPDVPPGWNYNPSGWLQRAPIIGLAFVGFFISRYLAAYQLGHIPTVWDPFFDDGTRRVLDSDVSRAWPVSDAGLGAVSYILEALSGFAGDTRRWRTMPWMVILFGILVVPLGVTSIVLIILQPLAVGAWCTLCLVTAAAMLIMIAPALDEVVATCQFLLHSRRDGRPFWRTFFQGGTIPGDDEQPPPQRRESVLAALVQAAGLNNIPWNLAVSAALGVWLMFAPSVLQTSGVAASSDQLVGALVVTFAVIAFGEIARAARLFNIILAVWLIAAPWFLSGTTAAAQWNDLAVGIALVFLSLLRGRVSERFGTWDRFVV